VGRPARLAIGILLLGVANLLLFLRGQAADPAAITTLVPIFGVPGLLLLISGLLPGRGVVGRTRMIFVPTRLVVGLSMTTAGVAVLYLYYQVVHVAPEVVLIGAMLAVPCGLLWAASCWTEACRNCSVPLKEFRARFNAGSRAMLEAAVRNGAVKEILALRAAPPSARRVGLLIRYCQRCRMVGLLEGPGKARAVLGGEQVTALVSGVLGSRQRDDVDVK
jgi:hypothetical protein